MPPGFIIRDVTFIISCKKCRCGICICTTSRPWSFICLSLEKQQHKFIYWLHVQFSVLLYCVSGWVSATHLLTFPVELIIQCHRRKVSYEKYSIDKIDVSCVVMTKWSNELSPASSYASRRRRGGGKSVKKSRMLILPHLHTLIHQKILYSRADACVSESSWLLYPHHRNPIR